MNTLQLVHASVVVKVTLGSAHADTLAAQLQPYVDLSPILVLDVTGVQFTSMLIGEMVNVHQHFEARWSDRPHRIALVNLTETSRAAFQRVRLDGYFTLHDTLAEACAG